MIEQNNTFKIKPSKSNASDFLVITGEKTYRVVLTEDLFDSHRCTCEKSNCIHIKGVIEYIESNCEEEEENIIYLDLETQYLADEVGGWHNIDKMKLAIAVIYISKEDRFEYYDEEEVAKLIDKLREADLIVGFNIKRFDYTVIQAYVRDFNLASLPTLDMLNEVYKKLGYRISLNALAKATLNAEKSADGIQSVEWFRRGEMQKVIDYCIQDVKVTRDLFLYGRKYGEVKFYDRRKKKVKIVKVDW